MNSTSQRLGRPRKGSVDKRQAIVDAARTVFGRVGYLGASIDLIAAEAEVSTRTIYNHFANKEKLFATTVSESSEHVAATHIEIIERHLRDDLTAADLEKALVGLAKEWLRSDAAIAEHTALVGRIPAESKELPPELVAAWRESGPARVQRALAGQLASLGERRLLRIDDPAIAAQHYIVLITNRWTSGAGGTTEPSHEQIDANAETGVHTFLYGHLPGR
ncbi:TetR/AcrR family transcriptional regulator [Nocardia sp. NPDC059180]|uniref:TetR/AcrR family transcriptional regulator n=1 Tax=Nocardia sp. NPDC059180 TaxID=3346761 RepID=UPI0036857B4A